MSRRRAQTVEPVLKPINATLHLRLRVSLPQRAAKTQIVDQTRALASIDFGGLSRASTDLGEPDALCTHVYVPQVYESASVPPAHRAEATTSA